MMALQGLVMVVPPLRTALFCVSGLTVSGEALLSEVPKA